MLPSAKPKCTSTAKLITHFGLVLKDVVTIGPHAVEMRRLLSRKLAFAALTVLGAAKSLKALFQHHGVLTMVAGVHLHVRRGYVTLAEGEEVRIRWKLVRS